MPEEVKVLLFSDMWLMAITLITPTTGQLQHYAHCLTNSCLFVYMFCTVLVTHHVNHVGYISMKHSIDQANQKQQHSHTHTHTQTDKQATFYSNRKKEVLLWRVQHPLLDDHLNFVTGIQISKLFFFFSLKQKE